MCDRYFSSLYCWWLVVVGHLFPTDMTTGDMGDMVMGDDGRYDMEDALCTVRGLWLSLPVIVCHFLSLPACIYRSVFVIANIRLGAVTACRCLLVVTYHSTQFFTHLSQTSRPTHQHTPHTPTHQHTNTPLTHHSTTVFPY